MFVLGIGMLRLCPTDCSSVHCHCRHHTPCYVIDEPTTFLVSVLVIGLGVLAPPTVFSCVELDATGADEIDKYMCPKCAEPCGLIQCECVPPETNQLFINEQVPGTTERRLMHFGRIVHQ